MLEVEAKRVFLGAVTLGASERDGYIARAAGDDRALRDRVQRLVRAHGDPCATTEEAPGERSADEPVVMPARVGGFRLLRRIGAGSSGTVYEAEQDRPRRRVAVKVLGGVRAERGDALEREAEVLARLRHPGIAQVLAVEAWDAGGGSLRPCVVMEMVEEARPITEYASARRLAPRASAGLLAEACDAVQHAHEKGVIHRDLKPGNLLVNAEGRVRLIDFGVARLCGWENGTLTAPASRIVGTVRYMSPEQAEGKGADARSDVYSLGAVLYELACGRPAHDVDGLTLAAALRRVRAGLEGGARPRRASPQVDPALEAVILKAMAPGANERYASAAALGAELRRYAAGEPVEAGQTSMASRMLRGARRRPRAVAAGALFASAAAALAAAAAWVRSEGFTADHLAVSSDTKQVFLESRNGARLATWDARPAGSILLREMVDRPRALGGGRLVLLGFDHFAERSGLAGHIGAVDAADSDNTLWTSAQHPLTPPGGAVRREATPTLDWAMLADVFPGVPGPEVVAVQSLYPYSATSVRVLDLSGRLRYEAWHDGTVLRAAWLGGAKGGGVLVLAALSSEKRWDERGHELQDGKYPVVVFALAPRDGTRCREWVVKDGRRLDPQLRWYRWLGPPEELRTLGDVYAGLAPPGAGWDSGTMVQVPVFVAARHLDADGSGAVRTQRAGFTLLIDADGQMVDRWEDDSYKMLRASGTLPASERLGLLEYERLPPATR